MCRTHQHAAGARKQGDLQKEPPGGVFTEPCDHGLGRSRGGFTTKLHLAVEQGHKPMSIVVTAGQRGDSPQFEPVLEKVRVPTSGRAGHASALTVCGPTRRTPPARTAPTCAAAGFAALSRTKRTRPAIVRSSAPVAADRRASTLSSTGSAMRSSVGSTFSGGTAPSPPATRPPCWSQRSTDGYDPVSRVIT
ncbi:hypothetical protein ACFC51_20150 [Streptomyces sp. NPDC055962]|uniref:hypothetical protein n=1 Tax=Streptomyces sp. NPDC055962 TaxID=3345667 RepID=UPI0035DBD44F